MFDLENFPTRELARDMMGMISPIYDNSYVGKWIFEVMSVPLSLAQDTINELRYDPQKGETYPYGMNDSTELFEKAGNIFISYVEKLKL